MIRWWMMLDRRRWCYAHVKWVGCQRNNVLVSELLSMHIAELEGSDAAMESAMRSFISRTDLDTEFSARRTIRSLWQLSVL